MTLNKKEWAIKVYNNALKKEKQTLNLREIEDSYEEYCNALNLNIGDTKPNNDYKVACVIAFKDRHKIMELNIKLLSKQTIVPAVILVVSNPADLIFANNLKKIYKNIFIRLWPNYPIGGKWDAGVKYAKLLNVNGVIILGSDDVISLGYIEECYRKIGKGLGSKIGKSDLVGNIRWMIYDKSEKLYSLSYNDKVVPIFLGGGRMFSKNFLDSCNWEVFKKYRARHLDDYGHYKVKEFSNKLELVSENHFILSFKGDWHVINTTDKILEAKSKIISHDITNKKEEIFKLLNLDNYNDYIK
jgi:hypothetical protein